MNTKKPSEKSENVEYHYPEEQFGEEVTPPEEPPLQDQKAKSGFLKLSRKKTMIVVAIVVVIGVIYQFLSKREQAVLESSKRELASVEAPITTKPTTKATSTAKTTETQTQAAALTYEQSQQLAKVAKLESTIQDLQTTVKQDNQAINDLNTALLSLANSVEVLSSQVRELSNAQQMAVVAPVATGGQVAQYHLKSVISGRAWLETGKGKLITVKVGDTIPGYGEVTSISPTEGLVGTSSGITITYGPNDS